MKKLLYLTGLLAFALATPYATATSDEGSSEQTQMTDEEKNAIATWTDVINNNSNKLPAGSVFTTRAGRKALMKLLKPYMAGRPQDKDKPRGHKEGEYPAGDQSSE